MENRQKWRENCGNGLIIGMVTNYTNYQLTTVGRTQFSPKYQLFFRLCGLFRNDIGILNKKYLQNVKVSDLKRWL